MLCGLGGNEGLVESNGSLPPGGWLMVTGGLTACTPASSGPNAQYRVWENLYLYLYLASWSLGDCSDITTQHLVKQWNLQYVVIAVTVVSDVLFVLVLKVVNSSSRWEGANVETNAFASIARRSSDKDVNAWYSRWTYGLLYWTAGNREDS